MFVPELGQADSNIYKNLVLDNITFRYGCEKSFKEMQESRRARVSWPTLVLSIFLPRIKSQTIPGLLLSTN